MKKWMGMLVAFLCFMLCGISVKADLIWEPEDSFYSSHWEACEHVDRVFIANGPGGEVILYESPESAKEISRLENGTEVYISFSYTDSNGVVWGVYDNGDVRESGWMPMEYMVVIYDEVSFAEEFADAIKEEQGQLEQGYAQVYFYDFPGSEGAHLITLHDDGADVPEYRRIFVDEKGRRWGNVSYYYGTKNHWICLDAPTADFYELWPEGAPQRAEETPEPPADGEWIVPGSVEENKAPFVALIVGGVVLVTALLLGLLKKSMKK